MATVEVVMPQMGESIAEGTVVKWHKKIGDQVKKDETLLEISTDKVDSEIPSPTSGTLKKILVEENQTVEVQTVVAHIETEGNGEVQQEQKKEEPVEEKPAEAAAEPETETAAAEKPSSPKEEKPKDRFYSPLVLNIARKENVGMAELENVPGTGAGGRVTKKDILKYIEDKKAGRVEEQPAAAPAKPQVEVSRDGVDVVPMDTMPVPMVVRLPAGGNIHGGPFHSRNPEAWFFHQPGLKLVAPSTPYDAKGLMKAAIRDPDPVLYFEYKYLYRRIKGDVPADDYEVPVGKADIKREGEDATIITYGPTVHIALEAAKEIANDDGYAVEVLDLRSLMPFDKDAILESVKRTNKVYILHEDTLTGGIGGELSAFITEHAFEYLDAPIKRTGAHDTPVPYAPTLEEEFLPTKKKVTQGLRELLRF